MSEDEFQEKNEFSDRTRRLGHKYYTELQPTFIKIQTEHTEKLNEGQTLRVGLKQESSIVHEFWNYYRQFNSNNLPKASEFYGQEAAELKISTLLRLFHNLYLEQIYPPTFPVPIIQKSYKSSRNGNKKYAKFFFIGDTHGSIIDTLKLIPFLVGEIQKGQTMNYEVKIVFIGDFVDRGKWDIHNMIYLMTFNLKYPQNVLLLRGNHEELSISARYGFGNRIIDNFSQMLFASFNYMFKDLPLIAIYHCDQGSIMCLHGGIPIISDIGSDKYKIPTLTTYKFNNRQVWIDDMDPITQQILWNDPIISPRQHIQKNFYSSRRGIGYEFGEEIFREFCIKNNVHLVFRGHQVFREGFHKNFDDHFITVFSASDYVNKIIDARFAEVKSNDIFNYKLHVIQNLNS